VARGELHLCALCALAPHLKSENSAELFGACRGKTRRQVEELLAARFPRPDVREQIRRLPVRAPLTAVPSEPNLLSSRARRLAVALDGPRNCDHFAECRTEAGDACCACCAGCACCAARPRRRELEPLSADRFGVHFTADGELRELIERARALASHQLPNGGLAGLIKLMAASFVRQEEKRRFGIGARPRRAKLEKITLRTAEPNAPPGGVPVSIAVSEPTTLGAVPAGERGRYLAAAVRREIHDRDRGRCAFVSADGRRCNARAFLEFDHVKPYARSGAADVPNLRLLCKAHNLHHARNCFGAMRVAAKIAARRLREQAIDSRK